DLALVERDAHARAARWRAAGVGEDLDAPVRPPASSALLETHLLALRHRPFPALPGRRHPIGMAEAVLGRLMPRTRARIQRLEESANTDVTELARAIAKQDVELAELRSRVGRLEEGRGAPEQ
ncbi:MAG: hypothetical protein ACRDYY_02635, partial [Acidimicrobiales bacterium]